LSETHNQHSDDEKARCDRRWTGSRGKGAWNRRVRDGEGTERLVIVTPRSSTRHSATSSRRTRHTTLSGTLLLLPS